MVIKWTHNRNIMYARKFAIILKGKYHYIIKYKLTIINICILLTHSIFASTVELLLALLLRLLFPFNAHHKYGGAAQRWVRLAGQHGLIQGVAL